MESKDSSRSREKSAQDGKRKKNDLFWTHHEKRKMHGERHHTGHITGNTEKRKTENKLAWQHQRMDWIDIGSNDKTHGGQEALEEHCT